MSGTVYFLDDMEKILENAEENIKETYFPCYYVSGYFKEWNELANTFDCWIMNKQLTATRTNLNKIENFMTSNYLLGGPESASIKISSFRPHFLQKRLLHNVHIDK